jgi:hypothetical protein
MTDPVPRRSSRWRLWPLVLIAVALLLAAAQDAQARTNIAVHFGPACDAAVVTVGRDQTNDPQIRWFETIDDRRVPGAPPWNVSLPFAGAVHDEPIILAVPRDGLPHKVWVRAELLDEQGRPTGDHGENYAEVTPCSPVPPPPPPPPAPPVPPVPPVPPSPHPKPHPHPRPCRAPSRTLSVRISPNPAPRSGMVTVIVRGRQLRRVHADIGIYHHRYRLHRHGRAWTVTMPTQAFGPPFPGLVRVRVAARQRSCGRTRTLVRVAYRRTLDP